MTKDAETVFAVPESGDVSRIRYLYSLSPQRLKREEDKREMIKYWTMSIATYCRFRGKLCCSASGLEREFTVYDDGTAEGFIPANLPLVLGALLKDGELLSTTDLNQWFNATETHTPSRPANASIFGDLMQGWGRWIRGDSNQGSATPRVEDSEVVSTELLRQLSKLCSDAAKKARPDESLFFVRGATSRAQDAKYSFRAFLRNVVCPDAVALPPAKLRATPTHGSTTTIGGPQLELKRLLLRLSDDDLLLLAAFMLRNGIAVQTATENGSYIFKVLGSITPKTTAPTVDLLDCSLLQLRANLENLDHAISENQCLYDSHMSRARQVKHDDAQALPWLRRARRVKVRIESLTKSAETLDSTLSKLECARDDAGINAVLKDAYVSATFGLRSLREGSELTAENAARAMEEFENELAKATETNDAVSAALEQGSCGAGIEDELLLAELEQLAVSPQKKASAETTPVASPREQSAPSAVTPLTGALLPEPIPADAPLVQKKSQAEVAGGLTL